MKSLPHDSAHTHVTGESEYVDDRPFHAGEVHVEVLYSPVACGEITKLNTKPALKIPGVVSVFTAKDFTNNKWGTIFQDQPLLAERKVQFAGECIALIVGETKEAARAGVRAVELKVEEEFAIRSIKEARNREAFIGVPRKIERGDVEKVFSQNHSTLEGEVRLEGADHFYLESQVSIAYPREDQQIEVHSSSQHPTEVQHVVAHALGLSSKDIVCVVKRMGGGFGGKESQGAPFAAYAALVANKLKRPARICISKDDDMIITGKRNPFENQFKVAFDQSGKILALDLKLYSDGGAYADLSTAIMERALLHSDNAYYIPHFRAIGTVCRTNTHPHTAFRGFGGPKGVATIEYIIEKIANHLGKDALEIRRLNVYSDTDNRNVTPYDQIVENNCLPKLFETLAHECQYEERRKKIIESNTKDPLLLKGLSLTAVKFGISFTTRFLNQANALVVIHRDGTLQVSTGATEMGQGVNARIAEIVSQELGLPRHQVRMMPTSTEKNANTSPTAASSGTDLNGAAALMATQVLKNRLSQLAENLLKKDEARWARKTAALGTETEFHNSSHKDQSSIQFKGGEVFSIENPARKISFSDLVNEAYLNRLSLSEYAHFQTPGLSFNKETGKGQAFLYYTQGVAASEVSVNRRTGEVKVLRVDILMDLGVPINEGLDLGQVTGAFIQGMGWMTTEKLFYSQNGLLLSHSPSTYKIPSIQDTPRVFNFSLFKNEENRVNVRSTKAAGEPPLLLSISVWTAIQDALKTKENFPNIPIPATQEEILRVLYPERFKIWEESQ